MRGKMTPAVQMVPARKKPAMEMHHRKPKSLGGDKSLGNTSHVKQTEHRAWHTLFGNKTPEEIAATINEKWLDPEYIMEARWLK